MASYKDIQDWVKKHYGFKPKTCWIADVKEKCGIPVKSAHNRIGNKRLNPCPPAKFNPIKDALKYFGMI